VKGDRWSVARQYKCMSVVGRFWRQRFEKGESMVNYSKTVMFLVPIFLKRRR
jgi:hypothetical protein